MQTTLSDGRKFAFNFVDGIGAKAVTPDKAGEDVIFLGGKHFKIDVMRLDFDKEDYLKEKKLYSIDPQSRKFPKTHCDLTFTRNQLVEEGFDAILLAFKQFMIYGYYSGSCTVDGEEIKLDKVFGWAEHVYSRW